MVTGDVNGDGLSDIIVGTNGNGVSVRFGNSDGTFGAAATYTAAGSAIFDLRLSDIDNYSDLDIVTKGTFSGNLHVLQNSGQGTFTPTFSSSSFAGAGRVQIVDLNGDENLDLVTSNWNFGTGGEAGYSVHLGDGSGSFSLSQSVSYGVAGGSASQPLVGDFTGDTIADIVLAVNDGNTNSVRLLRGSGQGTFSHHATISNGYYQQMRAADFNRDGRLDFVGVQEAGNVDVHTQSSTGSFTLTPFVVTNATSVELGDLDNDGDTDIVTGGYISFIPGSKQYRVLQNNGGAFTNLGGVNGGAMEGGGGPLSLVDFDGNGTLDIIGRGDHMILYSGNGDGTFGNSRTFFSGVNAFSVGDMNSDGTLDIVGIDSTSALGYTNDPDPVRTVTKLDPNSLRLRTRNEARTTLNAVNVLLRRLGLEQGGLGAAESRLNSALRNSQISRTVSLEASARIMDADIASESSALSRLRILREAGTAVLAQANLQPQIALQLLGG